MRRGTSGRIDEINRTSSLLRKILISAIIIVLILVLKSIDTDFTQKIVGYVRDGITKDMHIDEALGKLKFVSDFLPDTIAVFGQQLGEDKEKSDTMDHISISFTIPAEGKVVKQFGHGNSGIDISGTKNPHVYAVDHGVITATGEDNNGIYIRIDHGNKVISLYEGCSQVTVNTGDKVARGDKIGIMNQTPAGDYTLHFEAWFENEPIDPLRLMEGV